MQIMHPQSFNTMTNSQKKSFFLHKFVFFLFIFINKDQHDFIRT